MREAIKAALGKAECAAFACEFVGDMPAAAIAAFLRSLPPTPHQIGLPCPEAAARLAAVVEEAARDDR